MRAPSADTFSRRPAVTTAVERPLTAYKVYFLTEVVFAGECAHVPKHFKETHHNALDEKATETLQCLVPASCIAGRCFKGGEYLCPGDTDVQLSSADHHLFPLRRFKQSVLRDSYVRR